MNRVARIAVFAISLLVAGIAFAQNNDADTAKERPQGSFSASLESNTVFYADDRRINGSAPPHAAGSNNYLKADYTLGRLSAGLQLEYYPVPLQGYSAELQGIGLTGKYLAWNDRNWSITAGDFYEQFGSGLVLRTWEDRELGINNSIGGGRVTFNAVKQAVEGRVIFGFPRYYLRSQGAGYQLFQNFFDDYSRTRVAGGDLSLSLLRLAAPASDHTLQLEGSVVERYEKSIPDELVLLGEYSGCVIPKSVVSWSARLAWSWSDISIKAEYAGKGEDFCIDRSSQAGYSLKRGDAQIVEINYSHGGFAGAVTLRRLNNMQNLIFRTAQSVTAANTINYLPSLCQQQTYMLAGLNPYTTYADGEAGGQIDLFYNFRRGTRLGGRYGMKFHVNASMIYALPSALSNHTTPRMAYRDITIDLERTWSKRLKTLLFVSIQECSPTHGQGKRTDAQNVFVADVQYKFTPRFALRGELQYLYSQELTRDWVAGLLEASFAPRWSLYVSDMYNHGDTKIHYYSAGIGYSHSFLRVALGYGRNREGMVCSGGVCRWQPAYTGGNVQISLTF